MISSSKVEIKCTPSIKGELFSSNMFQNGPIWSQNGQKGGKTVKFVDCCKYSSIKMYKKRSFIVSKMHKTSVLCHHERFVPIHSKSL